MAIATYTALSPSVICAARVPETCAAAAQAPAPVAYAELKVASSTAVVVPGNVLCQSERARSGTIAGPLCGLAS